MRPRSCIVGLLAVVAMAAPASAYTLKDVYISSYQDMLNDLREIVPDGLTARQEKNLGKAIDRLDTDPSTMRDLLESLRRGAKPLAIGIFDITVTDVTTRAIVENGIIGILDGLRSDLEDIADDIEDRSEGEMRDEFPDGPPRMVLSDKTRRKVAKLLNRARGLINGRGDDWSLGKKGKAIKRRAKDLLEAIERLQKAERKLQNAGL